MRRVAGIDCGTNSIRLLIADIADIDAEAPGVRLRDVHREMRIVRLGQDVDRSGMLAAAALERTRVALDDYAATLRAEGAHEVRMVATSATRDAANRDEFVALVRTALGIEPEVISGTEEAALSFAGAASVLGPLAEPLLVVDVGGGSTELVRGGDGPLRSHSMDVGSVRMTERHLHDDPPTPAQVTAAVHDVRAAIGRAGADVPLDPGVRLVGVAGTVTTVAALALGLTRYDPDVLDGAVLTAGQVHEVTAWLLGASREQRAARPAIHPGRVDVIAGGALILRALVEQIGVDALTVSEHDILDGIVLSLA